MKISYSLILLAVIVACGSCTQSSDIPRGVSYPTQPGSYTVGEWQYSYEIQLKGSRSEKRVGMLYHKGVAVEGAYGDVKETPFGKFMYYNSGWNSGWLNTTTYDRRVFSEDGSFTKEVQEMINSLKKEGETMP